MAPPLGLSVVDPLVLLGYIFAIGVQRRGTCDKSMLGVLN